MVNIVTLTINSTHFYLVDCQGGRLLVDAGWSMARFAAQMKNLGIGFAEIHYVMFTHTHPDHAGLIQEIKERSGARLIIHEKQIPYLGELHAFLAKKGSGKPIRVEKGDLVSPDRVALRAAGIPGEIIETPGHSPDSISLLLESGVALTGDLRVGDLVESLVRALSEAGLPEYEMGENYETTCASWKRLVQRGARWIYPSHTDPFPLKEVKWKCLGKDDEPI